ncbi:MAG TPA: FkbM family methyltransferase [Vicinamibacterales bacterium]|nr:FkbM family methyltransferase [Vicinamibacterales bacterium]
MGNSLKTAYDLLTADGPGTVARVSIEKLGMWWRHGSTFDIGRFFGLPTPIARLDGCEFELHWPSVADNVRYLLLSGKHEQPERTLVKQFVPRDAPIVEFGAAFGVVSCISNRRLADPTQHVVVEANPALIAVLTANRNRNHCRFEVLHRAIAYDAPVVRLDLDENPLASRVHSAGRTVTPVTTTTLRRIVEERGFHRCTLVCDIEGGELDLVRHEADTIGDRVETIVLELHERIIGSEQTAEILARLRDIGFRIVARRWESVVLKKTADRGSHVR